MTIFNNCTVKDLDNGGAVAALSASNVNKFKEDHDFACTIDGQPLNVTATSATPIV